MRRESRECAFLLLFEDLNGKKVDFHSELVEEIFSDFQIKDEINKEFCMDLFTFCHNQLPEIQAAIENVCVGYTFDRIHRVDKTAIILACGEIKKFKTEEKVVFNECLNLVKKYGGEKSSSFVNGIFAKLSGSFNV